jgi:hypothetical protein
MTMSKNKRDPVPPVEWRIAGKTHCGGYWINRSIIHCCPISGDQMYFYPDDIPDRERFMTENPIGCKYCGRPVPRRIMVGYRLLAMG